MPLALLSLSRVTVLLCTPLPHALCPRTPSSLSTVSHPPEHRPVVGSSCCSGLSFVPVLARQIPVYRSRLTLNAASSAPWSLLAFSSMELASALDMVCSSALPPSQSCTTLLCSDFPLTRGLVRSVLVLVPRRSCHDWVACPQL